MPLTGEPNTSDADAGALLDRAASKRQVAMAILGRLRLMERWRQFGESVLCGAVAYDLVVEPDIDLEINCQTPRIEDGFSILEACALLPGVHRARFMNDLDGPNAGLYWHLRYRNEQGEDWKIDMWALPLDHPGPRAQDLVIPLRRALNDEARLRILDIKEGLLGESVAFRSVDVYRAVLDFGVGSLPEFLEWNRQHGETGLTGWRPRVTTQSG